MDPEDRRKHLDFIQAVVTRMSAASSTAKGWLLPVVTLTYGYALSERVESVALPGIAAVVVFAWLDANYLNQERAFRQLYDAVAQGTTTLPRFAMDPSLAAPSTGDSAPATGWRLVASTVGGWFPSWQIWLSWAIAPLYGSLFVVGVAIYACVRW